MTKKEDVAPAQHRLVICLIMRVHAGGLISEYRLKFGLAAQTDNEMMLQDLLLKFGTLKSMSFRDTSTYAATLAISKNEWKIWNVRAHFRYDHPTLCDVVALTPRPQAAVL
ncbi:hypothetical protein EVAR_14453_1 [Eumeta japonica]|uniref:Uncharacterized protein n=1 Tax=Eumeta variegata TaxID=151549 RepID=A0A4C1U391_EUMVA|nr:hypothetical protein EVAR_14453_1 [Eumeta japonica]